MSRQVSVCADCGTENDIHHHNCATHEQSPVLDKAAMLKLLARELRSWPKDCRDCERTEPAGWGWRWYDVPPDCEFVLGVDGTLGEEWLITESDWRKACWDAGEERMGAIGTNGPTGDHYAEAPTCADGLPCGVAHSPGDDAYCLHCPHEPLDAEDSYGESALSKVMDEQMQAAAEKWARGDMEARSKYHREIKPGVWVDVYDVLKAWGVKNPALQHLIKKALAPGERGHKTLEQDMADIVASAKRAKELEE